VEVGRREAMAIHLRNTFKGTTKAKIVQDQEDNGIQKI
jgi:hypothetical protein